MAIRPRWRCAIAASLATVLVLGACSDDAGEVQTAGEAPAGGGLEPLIIDPPPEGLTFEYGARNDPDEFEEAIEVYGRVDLEAPFEGPLAIHSWMGGEVYAGPLHEPVQLGDVEGWYVDQTDEMGPVLALSVQWEADGDRHEVVGLDVERDDLEAIASAAATGGQPPEGWSVMLRATQPDGATVSYTGGNAGSDRAWLGLTALAGDEAIYQLIRAMETRGMCVAFDQAVCGDPIEVRGQVGFLVSYDTVNARSGPDDPPMTGGEVHSIGWLDPSGWVVTVRAAGMTLDDALAATERITAVSWAEFHDLVGMTDVGERPEPVG